MYPLVSVVCITYNQASYIRECLEGLLMQKTSFNYEILVNDDASIDATPHIIKEYEDKYPDIFRVIYQKENQYSKGVSPWFDILFPIARGKYIAICEGDDYWTDPYKLQKQIDFLEENPIYGMVHTDFDVVNNSNETEHRYSRMQPQQTTLLDLLTCKSNIGTLTVVFNRNVYEKLPKHFLRNSFLMGDLPMWLEFAYNSKIAYIPEVTASYRRLDNSASHSADDTKQLRFYDNIVDCRLYYSQVFGLDHLNSRIEAHRYILREKLYYQRRCRKQVIRNFVLLCRNYPQHISIRSILYVIASILSIYR